MAQNINPLAFRLATNHPWTSVYHTYPSLWKESTMQDMFVRKLVHGVCLALSILTSEVVIKKKNNTLHISFIAFPLREVQEHFPSSLLPTYKENSSRLSLAFRLIKKVILKRYSQNLEVIIKETPYIASNPKILGDWVDLEVQRSPHQHQRILKQVLKEFQKISSLSSNGKFQDHLSKESLKLAIKKGMLNA